MIPDRDLLTRTFSSSNNEILEGDAVGRMYLTNPDMAKAQEYLTKKGGTMGVDPFTYFINGYLITNLLFTSVNFQLAEKSKIAPHFGDQFSLHYFGRSPLMLQVSGFLLNPHDDSHKAGLVSAYRYLLRLQMAAVMGTQPCISFLGYTAKGAMLNLKMSESANQEGIIQVNFDWMVFELYTMSLDNATLVNTDLATITDTIIGYC